MMKVNLVAQVKIPILKLNEYCDYNQSMVHKFKRSFNSMTRESKAKAQFDEMWKHEETNKYERIILDKLDNIKRNLLETDNRKLLKKTRRNNMGKNYFVTMKILNLLVVRKLTIFF